VSVLRGHDAWARARAELEGLPHGALNIAHEAVDRHAVGAARDRVAVRLLPRRGPPRGLTYSQLRRRTDRFACVLRDLGVQRGDCVATLLGPSLEVHVTAHGTFKHGAIFAALPAGLEAEAARDRLELADARVLVTTPALHARVIAPVRRRLSALQHVLLVGDADEVAGVPGALDLGALLARAQGGHHAARTAPDELALVHFGDCASHPTIGTLHTHEAVVAHHATAGTALDLRAGDVLWCAADPGSVPSLVYGVIGALTRAATCLLTEELDPGAAARVLTEERVAVWFTTPPALEALPPEGSPPPALRLVVSEAQGASSRRLDGCARVLGRPVHDAFWQAETGAVVIGGARDPAAPGSIGLPLPGIEAEVVRRTGPAEVELLGAGRAGELALREGWPSMACGYLHDAGRFHRRFAAGWYLTGHPARRDAEGRVWLLGPRRAEP
jgi:acetyl-CoA synthetase